MLLKQVDTKTDSTQQLLWFAASDRFQSLWDAPSPEKSSCCFPDHQQGLCRVCCRSACAWRKCFAILSHIYISEAIWNLLFLDLCFISASRGTIRSTSLGFGLRLLCFVPGRFSWACHFITKREANHTLISFKENYRYSFSFCSGWRFSLA